MRILVISHTYISPINRDKWKVLAQRHPNVSIYVVFPKQWPSNLFNHQAQIPTHESLHNCKFIALDTIREGNELLYRYAHKQLYNTLKTHRPNLIQVEQGTNAISYLQVNFLAKILGLKAKSIFFTWVNWKPNLSTKNRFFLQSIEKINLTCAHGAIVGNHDAKALLHEKSFSKPIMVLPQLGFNPAIFKKNRQKNQQNYRYIGYVGRLVEEKGVLDLAKVFLALHRNFPEWKLLFIGTGHVEKKLHDFVLKNQLSNRIEFCKTVPHAVIAQKLQIMDILVLPSHDTPTWREQFGHVLIEAMASGIPVIGSDAGEIPHVIAGSGLIFRQKDQASLLAQLQTLMQDGNLRKIYGALGHQRAHTHYSHEAIADKTYEFWQHLCE